MNNTKYTYLYLVLKYMKFNYIGRNNKGEKIYGSIDGESKKSVIKELKNEKIIVIKIKELDKNSFVEKLNIPTIYTNNTLKKIALISNKPKKKKETKNEKKKEKKPFFRHKEKKTNETTQPIVHVSVNVDKKDINNNSSKQLTSDMFDPNLFKKEKIFNNKETLKELESINVDAIINSDFKDIDDSFYKSQDKENKKNLLTKEIDLDSLKKLLNTDIDLKKDGKKIKKAKKVKDKELMMFCKKISTLLDTGIPITRALQLLMQQAETDYFQKILAIITKDVAQGSSLSTSMSRFPKVFSPHFTALVKTGEDTGEMAKTFSLLYQEIMDNLKLRGKIVAASIYPGIIGFVLLAAFIVAAKILVPMFTELFEGMGLPRFTEIVFSCLSFFDKYLFFILGGIFIVIIFIKLLLRNVVLRYRFDVFKLNIPVFGEVVTQYHMINILRTLDISLKNGLSIVEALDLAIQTTENISFKFELQKVLNKVLQGVSVSSSMQESPIFPLLAVQMLKIGEESGKMNELIEKTLDYYDWALNDFLDKSSKYIEPVAIILVAIFVVIFVFAIAIPMFDLSSGATITD